MISHDVPFSSQYTDLGDHEWRARGCGITSLKMVMDFWHRVTGSRCATTVDELLARGRAIGAYIPGVGWSHRGLVNLAREYGYEGFNADHAEQAPIPKDAAEAWGLLLSELARGPVLASVYSGLDPHRGGGHIVVVTGFFDGLVALNDPEEMHEREGRRLIALEVFLTAYKRRFIVIRPAEDSAVHHPTGSEATPGSRQDSSAFAVSGRRW
ncbi:MAG: C39 family peptidase [Candidatus Yanofskybacteria bacterium]|nr:C39 family peptidase [Candidatus Yanofskybacteria bacterium]